ncbi:serine--tRNA ligase [Candidatus Peregrinibacteria bacterium]|nr:serine--tRNA ligase [Candidatus Peregrinibacteria bacterium]
MFDIKLIIENPGLIKQGAAKKNVHVEVDKIVRLHKEKKEQQQELETLRHRQNEVSKEIPNADKKDKEKLLKEMVGAKEKIKSLEPKIADIDKELESLLLEIPNPPLDSVPDGKDENDNQVVRTHGKKPKFSFIPKDHIELGKSLDIIDIERGTRSSGTRFYYLKNEAVLLEFAIVQHVIHKLVAKGFSPVVPPVLVKEEAMFATGFFPAARNEIYSVNPGEDDLFLVGTSEVPLNMLHYTEILEEEKLPIRYCGFSTCFRREAGSYGKDVQGIIRVHQFDKIEMFSFCHPSKSEAEHELILATEEEIMKELGFHYQVVNICGGDLGAPAAKKYDIEVWIPTQEKFRELTSCSNCTDFQARRSQIRFKDGKNNKQPIHTLNGTATAIGRTLVAILENYQQKDGSVKIPEILQPYMGGRTEISKK